METRVNKYSEQKNMSRVSKHEELYKEINEGKLDDFTIRSNATVIGNQEQEIDVEKIKKILDKRYNDVPKRRSIRIEPKEEVSIFSDSDTKEYDLSKVLAKAKDEKTESYEESRAKKLRNTQYDILSNLNISDNNDNDEENDSVLKAEVEEPKKEEIHKSGEEDLMELINTITINEAKKKEQESSGSDPLDILTDLKGDENTQVYESIVTEVSKVVEVKEKEKNDTTEEKVLNKETITGNQILEKAQNVVKENKETIDNSFYTKNMFKKKDFEDEGGNEFVEENKFGVGIKILIVLVILCFLVGLFLFLKSFLNF